MSASAPSASPASPRSGWAVAAVVVGVVAFLTGWVPVWGVIAGAVAIGLGIAARSRGQSRAGVLTAIVLGAIAVITSGFLTISLFAFLVSGSAGCGASAVTTRGR